MAANDPVTALTERYDREATAYRELWAPVLRVAALKLLPSLSHGKIERALDLGTGVGTLLQDLSHAFPGALVLGVDRSRGMLAHAPTQYGRAAMDAEQLAITSGSMDRVVMVFMLFHLQSPLDGPAGGAPRAASRR
jgi:trans-aconitate methyltransferase